MRTPTSVLVIDDEPQMREGLAKLLAKEGYAVHQAADGPSGLRLLREAPVDVVLTDLRMPGLDGLEVLQQVKGLGLDVEVILLTAHGSIDAAVAAMKHGAYDFLTKPPEVERLLHLVRRAAERRSMVRRTQVLEAAREKAPPLVVANSAAMQRVLALVEQVATSDATVLIQGESGTGKEVIARALHARSLRHPHPLIAINCAAMPETLIESELFGYEKGAFTGAVRRKVGKFELADGGTLFLDEVAELAPAVQAKLLRVLQERELERLGGARPIPVDVRILAATNQDLRTLASGRRFREDLYYRLNVVTIDLPPLRERPEDLLPLSEHFLRLHAKRLGKTVEGFASDARAALLRYRWPGNVRELEHAMQRAAILACGPTIATTDLGLSDGTMSSAPGFPTEGSLADLERYWVLTTLARCDGNQSAAAQALGIDRSTLHRRLRQYGVAMSDKS